MRTEAEAIWSLQRFFGSVLPEPWDVRTDLEAGDPPERPFALIEQAGQAMTTGAPVNQDLMIPVTVNLFLPGQATREAATDAAFALREQVWQMIKWGPDPRRPTTDRIPLYCYTPRVETHRFRVPWWHADDLFTITVAGATTVPLTSTALAADIAAAIANALVSAGVEFNPGDIAGQDRGTRLWDVSYGGVLAGDRIGDPSMTMLSGPPAETDWATTILQGAPAPWRGPSDYMRVENFSQSTVRDPSDPTLVMVPVDLRLTFTRGLPVPSDLRILQRVFASVDSGPGG